MIYIDNFTEGFEASHLADYYSSSYNTSPDYTIADLHFAKRVTPPKGTSAPSGTAAPMGTAAPSGTSAPSGTAAPTGTSEPTGTAAP